MNVPENLKYTEDHEWVKVDGDELIIGITDYAQGELGDVVFVETPFEGDTFEKGESAGTIEAVKTVADVLMPISGTVTAINDALEDTPELLNKDAFGEGWIMKIRPESMESVNHLLDAETYQRLIS
jgi:glycine cleavage system H protein